MCLIYVELKSSTVKFSTRTRYAIRTMLEIGLHYETGGILQKDISVNQDIPVRTLDHLLHALKTAELITNCTGKAFAII